MKRGHGWEKEGRGRGSLGMGKAGRGMDRGDKSPARIFQDPDSTGNDKLLAADSI